MSNKQRAAGWAVFIGELAFIGGIGYIISVYYEG